MEFELNKTPLSCHRLMIHTQVVGEESMEMIVPDASPDIADLLDTSGVCCLHTKEVSEGTAILAGQIYCTILYLPEGDGDLNSLRAEMPFQRTLDLEDGSADCCLIAVPRILSAETRAVNPRKVLLRVSYEVAVRVYRPETLLVPVSVQEPGQVEERQEQVEGYFIIAAPERRFQFRDQMLLSGGQPPMSEVLRVQASVGGGEARLIGGKLVFKGEVNLRALYRSVEREILTAEFVLPYSQIMDAPEEEGAEFQMESVLLNWTVGEPSGDGRSMPVELDLYACAEIRAPRTLSLLADAYCLHCQTRADFMPVVLPQLVERGQRREGRRELIDTGEREVTVLDLRCCVVKTEAERKGDEVVCRAAVQADLLCVDETGQVERLSRHLTLESAIPVTDDVEASVSCVLTEGTALPAASGVELRVGVEFQPLLLRYEERLCISTLEGEEEAPLTQEGQPSIVLRQMTQGETLWDIAKNYVTTIREIQQANDLEDEAVEPERLLLIPRRR